MTNRWEKNLMQFNLLMNRKFLFHFVCVFGSKLKSQLILLFILFLQLFMRSIVLFGTIHGSYYTISTNFYLYLLYFQQNKRIPNRSFMFH